MKQAISKKIALLAILGVSTSFACANDLMKTENYYPNAKYGIGSRYARKNPTIEKVQNTVRLTGVISSDLGSIHQDVQHYKGAVHYERRFEDHPLSVHGSWGRAATREVNELAGTVINGKYSIVKAHIGGSEFHPQHAYDAKDGGDHPYDIYNYEVDGKVIVTSPRMQDLPKPLPDYPQYPYNPKADNANNQGQPVSGADDNRNRDLAGSDNPNMPNGSPDNSNQFNSDSDNPYNQDLTQNGGGWENVQALPPYYGYNNSPQQDGEQQGGGADSAKNGSGFPSISLDLTGNAAFAPGMGPNEELGINLVKYDNDGFKMADGGYIKSGGITGGGLRVEGSGNLQLTIGGSSDGAYVAKCGSAKLGTRGGAGGCVGFSGDTKKPYVSIHAGYGAGGGYWAESGISKSWSWENVINPSMNIKK